MVNRIPRLCNSGGRSLRRAKREPSMHFRRANTEHFKDFRKANTEQSITDFKFIGKVESKTDNFLKSSILAHFT